MIPIRSTGSVRRSLRGIISKKALGHYAGLLSFMILCLSPARVETVMAARHADAVPKFETLPAKLTSKGHSE